MAAHSTSRRITEEYMIASTSPACSLSRRALFLGAPPRLAGAYVVLDNPSAVHAGRSVVRVLLGRPQLARIQRIARREDADTAAHHDVVRLAAVERVVLHARVGLRAGSDRGRSMERVGRI